MIRTDSLEIEFPLELEDASWVKIGDKVKNGDIIAELHSDNKSKIKLAASMISRAIIFSNRKPLKLKLIKKIIS